MGSPEDMLMAMVFHDHIDGVRALLKNDVNVNYLSREGVTPLLGAIEKGNYHMTKLLLNNGADCNGRGRLTEVHYAMGAPRQEPVLEWTPTINAALYGHPGILELLVEHGADINYRDINGRSALNAALQRGKQRCVEILINHGAEITPVDIAIASITCPNMSLKKDKKDKKSRKNDMKRQSGPTLHSAILEGDRERLREIIKKGANLNAQDSDGKTALHIAIEKGYLGCAELLVKKGVDVNVKGGDGGTALHLAASLGIASMIPLLVEHGAIVDAEYKDKSTPLHCSVTYSHPLCVNQLLNHGANVNAVFLDGKTALHVAVSGAPECIELLIKENANIFAKDDTGVFPLELAVESGLDTFKKLLPGKCNVASLDGITPIHIASRCLKTQCLEYLIEIGCDVNVETNYGDTPLHFSCFQGGLADYLPSAILKAGDRNPESIELLVKAGADIHKKNKRGLSPIHICAKNGLLSYMKTLHTLGADVNALGGDKKRTPLHFASEIGNLPCIKYLIDKGADKKAVDTENSTALMLAARKTHFSCIKFLLEIDVPLWAS